jgi:NADPH-dependent curcumin reductase CurA
MYHSVVLAKRPQSTIVPSETFTIKTKKVPTKADLKNGEVIFQTLYLSLDPAMRGWLNGMLSYLCATLISMVLTHNSPWAFLDTRSYIPPVQIGEVMRGVVIGEVVESKAAKFPVGTYATTMAVGWSELGIVKEKNLERLDVPKGGKLTDALGVLGIPILLS